MHDTIIRRSLLAGAAAMAAAAVLYGCATTRADDPVSYTHLTLPTN